MALALLLQCEGLWAQGAQNTEQAKKVVARYIQAIQQADLKTIIDLQSKTPRVIAAIKASNPQVLWPKLIGQYYDESIAVLSKDIRGNAFQAFLPPSCKWNISEVRADAETATVYLTVDYPSVSDAPIVQQFHPYTGSPIGGSARLLKQTILQFLVDTRSQLMDRVTFVRLMQADAFWETPRFMILNVSWNSGKSFGDSPLGVRIDVLGGSTPFHSTIRCGSLTPQMKEHAAPGYIFAELEAISDEDFPLQCSLTVKEGSGRSDEVAFTVPQTPQGIIFVPRYCWVRNPWRLRGQGTPDSFCSLPIREFESGQSTAAQLETGRLRLLAAVGRYVSESMPQHYRELKADGTFYDSGEGLTGTYAVTGTYVVKGDQITFKGSGWTVRSKISENRIVDPDGETFTVKRPALK